MWRLYMSAIEHGHPGMDVENSGFREGYHTLAQDPVHLPTEDGMLGASRAEQTL